MNTLLHDLRYGLRTLAKNPGFTAVAVLTLALGIGANTAIFSVVNAVLLRPLPYPQPDRLVAVGQMWRGAGDSFSPADFLDLQAQNHVFEQMAAFKAESFNLATGDRPERLEGAVVTTNLFGVLGVRPFLGRGFLPEDAGSSGNRAVVLSNDLWRRRFGASARALGQNLILNAEPFTVVGVMPRGFGFPEGVELWVAPRYAVPEHPLRPGVNPATMRGAHYFDSIARLKAGVTLDQARADLEATMKRIVREHPDSDFKDTGPWIVKLHDNEVGNVRPALLVLLGAVGLVLLIACANVASLMLARGEGRRKELAIRRAVGASRGRVARQLLTESVLLATLGGGLGTLMAYWGFAPLAALVPAELRSFAALSLDARVLVFTMLVSLLAGLAFGIVPAVAGLRAGLVETLKEGGRTEAGGRHRAQEVLVVSETALALVLLVGAGLLMRSFLRLLEVPEGFDPSRVLALQISLPRARYSEPRQRDIFVKQILGGIRSLPGVRSASVVTRLPLNPGGSARSIEIEGRPPQPGEDLTMDYSVVSPDYFRTLHIPLEGRDFSAHDDARSPGVVIINQTMAKTFWPGQDAVGKRLKMDDPDNDTSVSNAPREIVGVVGDVRQRDLSRPSRPIFYAPYAQDPWPFMDIAVHAAGDPSALSSEVQRAIQSVDKDEPVYNVRTMQEIVARSVSPRRFNMLLLGLFAALALVLAAIGLFGVMSYSVSQRTHEIGIRMALGAERGRVLKAVLAQGLKLTLAGLGAGLVISLALTRAMASLLFGVRPADPVTFAAVAVVLTGVALLASYLPARRATKVDPVVALRHE
ncbi:MAG TPA: ABC transporter permease [Terriglobia bacterium]|nr:ABC transporter permease [Terriglobia bacterium]